MFNVSAKRTITMNAYTSSANKLYHDGKIKKEIRSFGTEKY